MPMTMMNGSDSLSVNGTEVADGDGGYPAGQGDASIVETVMMVTKAILGTVATFQNLAIFLLLSLKKKRVVSSQVIPVHNQFCPYQSYVSEFGQIFP